MDDEFYEVWQQLGLIRDRLEEGEYGCGERFDLEGFDLDLSEVVRTAIKCKKQQCVTGV